MNSENIFRNCIFSGLHFCHIALRLCCDTFLSDGREMKIWFLIKPN